MSESDHTTPVADTTDDASALEALQQQVDSLNSLVDIQDDIIESHQERIADLTKELEAVRNELDQHRRDVDATLSELDARTDLLKDANAANATQSELRAARLVQKLADKAHGTGADRVTLDAKSAWATLDYNIDRTSVYDIFRRAEDLVGRPDVLYYKQEDRSSDRSSRLVYDRSAGELPGVVAGTDISGCGRSTTRNTGPTPAQPDQTTHGGKPHTD